MREEYDLKKLKIKRRGILPDLQGQRPEDAKLSITIALDEDVVDYFKAQANVESIQTRINQILRRAIQSPSLADTEVIKRTLLQDSHFLREVANNIAHLPIVQRQGT
ncbi:hypothetical protein PN36_25380 [Candidatus Thiomargarita nelsonii]|uniref:CopG family transcriptional regulator n=1 Tax=Candidatus Thiomargarita nelsonii TaxID=1003181 RepID=A0A0A6P7J8_9GAMM|nr:hypothetical protein PN36_25380 [Candidatus Thiomargarita nelsonii]